MAEVKKGVEMTAYESDGKPALTRYHFFVRTGKAVCVASGPLAKTLCGAMALATDEVKEFPSNHLCKECMVEWDEYATKKIKLIRTPPEWNDGQHWSPVTISEFLDIYPEHIKTWFDEALVGELVGVEIIELTQKEMDELPDF